MYAFDGDIWCDDCGRKILVDIENGKRRDWGEKPVRWSDSEEADYPQFCAAGEYCENKIELKDGTVIGGPIQNSLTQEGHKYIKELYARASKELRQVYRENWDWADFEEPEGR